MKFSKLILVGLVLTSLEARVAFSQDLAGLPGADVITSIELTELSDGLDGMDEKSFVPQQNGIQTPAPQTTTSVPTLATPPASAPVPTTQNIPQVQLPPQAQQQQQAAQVSQRLPMAPVSGAPAQDGTGFKVSEIGEVIALIDSLVAIGQRVWSLAEKGRPVISTNMVPSVGVFPQGVMEDGNIFGVWGWSDPVSKEYNIRYKNKYGATVVDFKFKTVMQYGGKDKNGKGAYITGVSILPSSLNVAFLWDLSATTKLINVSNIGTLEDPVAAATLELNVVTKTIVQQYPVTMRFFFDGRGRMFQAY